jgi:cytoskeleton protein RodZ
MASLGQGLREAREARHISLKEIASSTKIVRRYLEALENDHLEIMPGSFFIKGIIRAYANAIGLDGEEVLARYKAAGLVGEPERKRHIFPRAAAEPAPPFPPAFVAPAPALPPAEPAATPAPAAERAPTPEASPAPKQGPLAGTVPAPGLLFEPASKPRLSPATRKRILSVIWRLAAAAAVATILAVLWSSRRPRPPEAKPGVIAPQAALAERPRPTVPQTTAGTAPSPAAAAQVSQPGAQPSAPVGEPVAKPEPGPPAAAEPVSRGVAIEISFHDATWIHVRGDGEIKINGVFPAGTTARAQADRLLLIHTGNAGGFTFLLNGERAKPLGRSGQVITDIKITPANYRDFLEVRPPGGPPAG